MGTEIRGESCSNTSSRGASISRWSDPAGERAAHTGVERELAGVIHHSNVNTPPISVPANSAVRHR